MIRKTVLAAVLSVTGFAAVNGAMPASAAETETCKPARACTKFIHACNHYGGKLESIPAKDPNNPIPVGYKCTFEGQQPDLGYKGAQGNPDLKLTPKIQPNATFKN